MKLSIVVPAYNVEHYLSECLDSLLDQDLWVEDYEIIVVNDGSTDGTLKIAEHYCQTHTNINVFSQQNSGLSVTRNKGFELSTGNYILFVDSDDLLVPKSLKNLCDYIKQHDLDFLGFGHKDINGRKASVSFSPNLNIIAQGSGNEIIESHKYWNGACWYIFNKSKAGDLRFIPGMYVEDAPFTPRLILAMDKCVVIDTVVYLYYRGNPGSITTKKSYANNKKLFKDMFTGAESFHELYAEYPLSEIAYNKLRIRQETFVYFGIIRFLRLHADFSMVNNALNKLQFDDYKVYPIKKFKGNNKLDTLLLFLINHKILFRMLNFVNRRLRVIK